jgi:hypothetical protein
LKARASGTCRDALPASSRRPAQYHARSRRGRSRTARSVSRRSFCGVARQTRLQKGASSEDRRQRSLDADKTIRLLDETGDVGWSYPLTAKARKVFVSRPTGDRASLSDVHRYLVRLRLREQVAQGRDAEALEAFASIDHQQLRGVAGQHDADSVANLQ